MPNSVDSEGSRCNNVDEDENFCYTEVETSRISKKYYFMEHKEFNVCHNNGVGLSLFVR